MLKIKKKIENRSFLRSSKIVPIKTQKKDKAFYQKQAKIFIKQYGKALSELSER